MPEPLRPLIEAAFEYALPLHIVAATRWRAVSDQANPDRHHPNTLRHIRQLSDHRSRWITAPNNDTLYSNAWLDLSAGPVRLSVAAQPSGRYWSVALMDAFSNHIAVLGQRLQGTGPVDVTIVGPRHHHLDFAGRVIRAPGADVWLFGRFLVEGPQDLPQAYAMQDRMALQSLVALPACAEVVPGELVDPVDFLATVNAVMARNPPPPADGTLLARCSRVGLRPGEPQAWLLLDSAAQEAWHAHIAGALERVRQLGVQGRRNFQGWIGAASDIGNFGTNFALRASVALGGLGALEPDEAMYFVRYTDDHGASLNGQQSYCLMVPPDGIACDSFWSITMYQSGADGRRYFVANQMGRYSIGNRTMGLRWQPDGGIAIRLSHSNPLDESEPANWLPAPAGVFQIALRCYLPRKALQQGEASMPRILPLRAMA